MWLISIMIELLWTKITMKNHLLNIKLESSLNGWGKAEMGVLENLPCNVNQSSIINMLKSYIVWPCSFTSVIYPKYIYIYIILNIYILGHTHTHKHIHTYSHTQAHKHFHKLKKVSEGTYKDVQCNIFKQTWTISN